MPQIVLPMFPVQTVTYVSDSGQTTLINNCSHSKPQFHFIFWVLNPIIGQDNAMIIIG